MKTGNKITLGVLALAAGALALLKKNGVAGIGAVDWAHARWRAENELGIDFSKSYFEQSWSATTDLANLGKKMGYRRSYDNGKSYGRAFFDAIKSRTHDIEGCGLISHLAPKHDSRASFYGKAVLDSHAPITTLYSYDTPVAEYNEETGILTVHGWYSATTARHIREFAYQLGIDLPAGKNIEGQYRAEAL